MVTMVRICMLYGNGHQSHEIGLDEHDSEYVFPCNGSQRRHNEESAKTVGRCTLRRLPEHSEIDKLPYIAVIIKETFWWSPPFLLAPPTA